MPNKITQIKNQFLLIALLLGAMIPFGSRGLQENTNKFTSCYQKKLDKSHLIHLLDVENDLLDEEISDEEDDDSSYSNISQISRSALLTRDAHLFKLKFVHSSKVKLYILYKSLKLNFV